MAKATRDILEAMHGLLAANLVATLQEAVAEGKPVPAAIMAQVNQFLRQNDIRVDDDLAGITDLQEQIKERQRKKVLARTGVADAQDAADWGADHGTRIN